MRMFNSTDNNNNYPNKNLNFSRNDKLWNKIKFYTELSTTVVNSEISSSNNIASVNCYKKFNNGNDYRQNLIGKKTEEKNNNVYSSNEKFDSYIKDDKKEKFLTCIPIENTLLSIMKKLTMMIIIK
jgi:hypothetical protein